VIRHWLHTAGCIAILGIGPGCGDDEEFSILGEGEAEGEADPCAEVRAGNRRYAITPGLCPGTSDPCVDPQAPTGCNVRPPNESCTSPPVGAIVLEVCPACPYTTISAAVAAIPDPPGAPHFVVVHGGNYIENVVVTQDGSSSDTITVAARCNGLSRESVTINYSTDNPVLTAAFSSDYVNFEGFRIIASPVAAFEGAVALIGNNATARYIVVDGAGSQAAFYVEGSKSVLEEIDSHDSYYGLQVFVGDEMILTRGAFCGSRENGMQLEGGNKHTITASLVKDSALFGIHADLETDLVLNKVLVTGHLAAGGGGMEIWDVHDLDVLHTRLVDNRFGLVLDLDAEDLQLQNVLFERNETGILVNAGYTRNHELRVHNSTLADGLYGMRLLAPIKIKLRRNIFFAGSTPGGYGIEITDGAVDMNEEIDNLFYGNFGVGQTCIEAVAGQCAGVVWSTSDPHINADGYYLEQDLSAAVDTASDSAASVSLYDGTRLEEYTTALDWVLDTGNADLGFHHQACCETCGDDGCGDGYCAGDETSGTCPQDCL